jgi:hypothetical protein
VRASCRCAGEQSRRGYRYGILQSTRLPQLDGRVARRGNQEINCELRTRLSAKCPIIPEYLASGCAGHCCAPRMSLTAWRLRTRFRSFDLTAAPLPLPVDQRRYCPIIAEVEGSGSVNVSRKQRLQRQSAAYPCRRYQ